jgi:hypothetical protein
MSLFKKRNVTITRETYSNSGIYGTDVVGGKTNYRATTDHRKPVSVTWSMDIIDIESLQTCSQPTYQEFLDAGVPENSLVSYLTTVIPHGMGLKRGEKKKLKETGAAKESLTVMTDHSRIFGCKMIIVNPYAKGAEKELKKAGFTKTEIGDADFYLMNL